MTVDRIANTDFQSLNELKQEAKVDAKKALPAVAKQFEGIFLKTLMKTMRTSEHFVDQSNPFRGRDSETFQELLDGQYVSNMTKSPAGIGIADMLTKQLGGSLDKTDTEQQGSLALLSKPFTLRKANTATPATGNASGQLFPSTAKNTKGDTAPESIDNFIKSIWDKAKQAASIIGLDPKILIAQAALETGWGKFVAKGANGNSSNNLFNIKASHSDDENAIKIKTTEYIADTPIKVSASFRKYSSIEDSFDDYISLITGNQRYQNAVTNATNPERYVNELSKAGYATDPKYGSKILSIYHSNELNDAMKRCGL